MNPQPRRAACCRALRTEGTREAQWRLIQARAQSGLQRVVTFCGEMLLQPFLHPKNSQGEKGPFSPYMKSGAQGNNLT